MKALEAGKIMLLEKPSSNTAGETRRVFELAEEKGEGVGVVRSVSLSVRRLFSFLMNSVLSLCVYKFYPADQRVKEVTDQRRA